MLTILTLLAAAASNPGLAKPVPPVLPSLSVADCENTSVRNAKVAQINGDGEFGQAGEKYNAAWRDYVDERLAKLGMNKQERSRFLQDVVGSSEFADLLAKNEALMAKMTDDFQGLADVKGDEAQCKIVSKMISYLTPMLDNSQKQWELIDGRIDAEAQRRGIKLD